jgi:hypothetical protein
MSVAFQQMDQRGAEQRRHCEVLTKAQQREGGRIVFLRPAPLIADRPLPTAVGAARRMRVLLRQWLHERA